jgi:hypothetical protein
MRRPVQIFWPSGGRPLKGAQTSLGWFGFNLRPNSGPPRLTRKCGDGLGEKTIAERPPYADRLLSVGRSCAFRHLVGVRANLGGYGYDSKRQHPNRHNRRKGDRQGARISMVDETFIVKI